MNEEHYAKLKEGVEAWNKWRKENPVFRPNLTRADLKKSNLSGANLFDANLSGADLSEADLRGTDLMGANLREANLSGADLSEADLLVANLSKADLREADLREANLGEADLNEADLSDANLSMALLRQACLNRAQLRNCKELLLDDCEIEGTRFSPGAKDPWSVLRRTYSGPRYALHLIFLIAFLVPYIAKALMWTGVTNTQQAIVDLQGTIQQAAETVADSTYQPLAIALETAAERLADYVPSEETGWRRFRVYQLLVGWDKNWLQVALVLVLLLYNGVRWKLTSRVSLLREEEERSHYAPALSDYWRLYQAHRVVQILLFVALASFAYHAWYWLTQEVWLPPWL